MAVKVVTGTDGRTWTVRRQMLLRMPATGDEFEFEHDVEGGNLGLYVILGLLGLFVVALISRWSSDVPMPFYIKLLFLLILGFFPVRWFLRRPWQLVAETPGIYDPENQEEKGKEHWVGTVRGVSKARDEAGIVIRTIRMRGRPGLSDGPMKPNP